MLLTQPHRRSGFWFLTSLAPAVVYDINGREADEAALVLDAVGPIQQYIFCSSAGVYQKSEQMPHREEDEVDFNSRHKVGAQGGVGRVWWGVWQHDARRGLRAGALVFRLRWTRAPEGGVSTESCASLAWLARRCCCPLLPVRQPNQPPGPPLLRPRVHLVLAVPQGKLYTEDLLEKRGVNWTSVRPVYIYVSRA
jgi:hypothetical protein